jgi:glycine betaine catabolism B
MRYIVRILDIIQVTHDVKCFRIEKPAGYIFTPGKATDVSINKKGMVEERRPFTFTCLVEEAYLEFTIKRYPDHHGVTDLLHQLNPGDELIIEDAWGAIEYKGPGYFIAGGAGITPFIGILRALHKENRVADNTLFFSNKSSADIICEKELSQILQKRAVFILSRENKEGYKFGKINEKFIEEYVTDFSKYFYVCGPDLMVQEIVATLKKMGANPDTVVFEQ